MVSLIFSCSCQIGKCLVLFMSSCIWIDICLLPSNRMGYSSQIRNLAVCPIEHMSCENKAFWNILNSNFMFKLWMIRGLTANMIEVLGFQIYWKDKLLWEQSIFHARAAVNQTDLMKLWHSNNYWASKRALGTKM